MICRHYHLVAIRAGNLIPGIVAERAVAAAHTGHLLDDNALCRLEGEVLYSERCLAVVLAHCHVEVELVLLADGKGQRLVEGEVELVALSE